MSYKDDEDLNMGPLQEEDLDLDAGLPPPDDGTLADEEDEPEGFAGLDGSEY